MTLKKSYEDTLNLYCLDQDKTVVAEILDFHARSYVTVTVNRAVEMRLSFNESKNLYTAKMAGLEFSTPGPKETVTYQGRRR